MTTRPLAGARSEKTVGGRPEAGTTLYDTTCTTLDVSRLPFHSCSILVVILSHRSDVGYPDTLFDGGAGGMLHGLATW